MPQQLIELTKKTKKKEKNRKKQNTQNKMKLSYGEQIVICTKKRHNSSFSYAIKRDTCDIFEIQFANIVAKNFDFNLRI